MSRTKPDNFLALAGASRKYSNRSNLLDAINGKFFGQAHVTRGQRPPLWDMEFLLQSKMTNGHLDGRLVLKLSENGKVFSDSNDGGTIASLRELADSKGLLISASPTISLQVYYVKSMDSLVGNIFEQNDKEDFVFIGTFRAARVN